MAPNATPLYTPFDVPNVLELDGTLAVPQCTIWPGRYQNFQQWCDDWNNEINADSDLDNAQGPTKRQPKSPGKKGKNKEVPKFRASDKAYRCSTGAYITRIEKPGPQAKDDKRIHKDLLDELSLPILPVQCPATLSAMNTPMASGRKDAPGIDAALAKYRGGWRLACDTCLALYIPEVYTGPSQTIPVAKMKALGLNKNYLTLVKLVEYGPFIICRGCIGVTKGKGMLPSCGPCRVVGEKCKKVDPANAIRMDDPTVHPIDRARRALTIIWDQGQMQQPDRIRIAQYGLDCLRDEICHGLEGSPDKHTKVSIDAIVAGFDESE